MNIMACPLCRGSGKLATAITTIAAPCPRCAGYGEFIGYMTPWSFSGQPKHPRRPNRIIASITKPEGG